MAGSLARWFINSDIARHGWPNQPEVPDLGRLCNPLTEEK